MKQLTDIPPELFGSPQRLMVHLLPGTDRATLRTLAVPRLIDEAVAETLIADASTRNHALTHPLLEPADWVVETRAWFVEEGVRAALLDTFFERATTGSTSISTSTEELSALHDTLARHFAERGDPLENLYHRLGATGSRADALRELESRVETCLSPGDEAKGQRGPRDSRVDVAGAHELLRLLEDRARLEDSEAHTLLERLRPRLERRSRWVREREATSAYYERAYEAEVWDRLIDDDGRWILQLHAPGGAGKTMFVQNLVGRRCPAQEIPCARVDFDFVAHLVTATNQPWRILLLIARQLDRQIEGSPFESLLERYGRFEARAFHQGLGRRFASAERADGGSDTELEQAASEVPLQFRALLAESRGGRPVVVVLDTLENLLETEGASLLALIDELARVHHGDDEATHSTDRVAGLRLVLSGRFDLGGRRRESWGGEHEQAVARVAGFEKRYIGESVTTQSIGGTELTTGQQVATLLLPRFSPGEAEEYLELFRGIDDIELRQAIVDKADGNPMKLTLLADAVRQDPKLDAEHIRAFDSSDLFYLVDRVIDRILDPQVQWLVRWGVVPRLLTRDFVERILWPLFREQQSGDTIYDRTAAEAETVPAPIGGIRYAQVDPDADASRAWQKLTHYAAAASWVSVVPELPDTLVFHPDVRDPMRGLLRRHDQKIYHELSRRAFADLEDRCRTLEGAQRAAAYRALVFHAWEPWRGSGRPEDPDRFVVDLLDDLGDAVVLRSEVAREVLDVERRTRQRGVTSELGPSDDTVARAHTEITRRLAREIESDPTLVPQLREHLGRSDLPLGLKARIDGLASMAEGRREAAIASFGQALVGEGLTDPSRVDTLIDLGTLTADGALLEEARGLATDDKTRRRATRSLAALAYDREEITRAEALYGEVGDAAGRIRSLLALGKPASAEPLVEEAPEELQAGLRLLVDLQAYRPLQALDAVLRGEGDDPERDQLWWIYQARALALLAQEDDALSRLDGLIHQGHNANVVLSAIQTAARLALIRNRPEEAQETLARAPEDLPVDRGVQVHLLAIEAKAALGSPDKAWRRLDALDATPDADAWLPSTRMAVALARLRFRGVEAEGLDRLLASLETVDSPSRRLFLLSRLRWVGTPRSVDKDLDRKIRKLTQPPDDAGPRLILARAELLRVLRRPGAARRLLIPCLTPDPQHVVWRFARLALDRVGWTDGLADRQPPAPESFPEPFRTQVAKEQEARLTRPPSYPGREGLGPWIREPAPPATTPRDTAPQETVRGDRGDSMGFGLGSTDSDSDSGSGSGTKEGYLAVGPRDVGSDAPPDDGGYLGPLNDGGTESESTDGYLGPVEGSDPKTGRPTRGLDWGQETHRGPSAFEPFLNPDPAAARLLAERVEMGDPEKSYVSTRNARALLEQWPDLIKVFGQGSLPFEVLAALSQRQETGDLVIALGPREEQWIPWHLGEVEGFPLARIPGVRSLVRGTRPPGAASDPVASPEPSQVAVVASVLEGVSSKVPHWADNAMSSWHRRVEGPVAAFEGLWDKALADDIDILHLIAALEERRGSVAARVASEWGDAVATRQLARVLEKRQRPLLLILDVPWPGSLIQAAHQLMLREIFAAELLRRTRFPTPEIHILATGFAQLDTSIDLLGTLIQGLTRGDELGAVTGRLQRLTGSGEGSEADSPFAQSLIGSSVLYSERPNAIFRIGDP